MPTTNLGTLAVRVAARREEALDIASFELVACDGRPLPPFSAGAHIDVRLDTDLVRQYSLCNDPADSRHYLIAVLRDAGGRGGSRAMHDRLRVGDVIEISTPRNHFPLAHGARRSLLLAGGIGITPILCMGERLARVGADFEMHYCTRSRERTAFVERIANSGFATRVHFHFDDGPEVQRFDVRALFESRDRGEHVYACGPKGFIEAVLETARARGWPESQLHYEFFGAAPVRHDADANFEVQLASSGEVFVVPPGRPVTEVLAEAGVAIPTSCGQGVCGTCVTRVLEGTPDHRDLFLTPEEQATNDQFTPCCSRSLTPRLVLDL